MRRILIPALLVFAGAAVAQEEVRVGFLGLDPDPRRNERMAYAQIELAPKGDSRIGAEMAVADMKIMTDALGLEVTLDAARVGDSGALAAEAQRMAEAGAAFIVLDLPATDVDALAASLGEEGPELLNATAPDDWLRRRCHPNLLHTAASDRMVADAFVQLMAQRQWDSVLVLQGKEERDVARADAFVQSAERFRIEIVDRREFDLSTNPALREENNVTLLTGGTDDYDVIFVADEVGEFSRYIPYQAALPRPVIGATGLVATEWHWALERYGAPQVNSRFQDMSEDGRRMGWQDWSVWAATRAVLTAYAKSEDRSAEGVEAYLRSDRLRLDGSKGAQMSFREWDGQLRQPILLATANAIIAVAPLKGFIHQTNTLDALGTDAPEFACD